MPACSVIRESHRERLELVDEHRKKFSIDPAKADPSKPIKIIEWASSTWEPSLKHLPDVSVYNADKTVKVTENPTINPGGVSEFTNGNIRGLEAWAANPTKGRDLSAGLVQAFTDGAAQDWARTLGMTHPGAIGPGLSLGAPDDTKVSNMKLQLGGGGTTITTTTGPVTVTEGSPWAVRHSRIPPVKGARTAGSQARDPARSPRAGSVSGNGWLPADAGG